MESPEEIEKALGRLVPAAMSERGNRALERTIDGLAAAAGVAPVQASSPGSGWWTAAVAVPTAAAAALAVALVMSRDHRSGRGEDLASVAGPEAAQTVPATALPPSVFPLRDDLPGDVPMKVLMPVSSEQGTASFSLASGKLVLASASGVVTARIFSPAGDEIFHGSLEDASFPQQWKKRAEVLGQELEKAMGAMPRTRN